VTDQSLSTRDYARDLRKVSFGALSLAEGFEMTIFADFASLREMFRILVAALPRGESAARGTDE
jgi:hypothetical protein